MQAYNKIDQQLHQLAQILAKFNRSFVAPEEDDSHTNLAFDALGERLIGRWTQAPDEPKIMALNLRTGCFEMYDGDWKVLFEFRAAGKTYPEIERSIANLLGTFDFDARAFAAPMHYEIPAYTKGAYAPFDAGALSDWMNNRSLANDSCFWLLNHLQKESEIRIWPHHFDTGIYVEPASEIGLGFGLAMQDALAGTPYYYLSGYGLNGHEVNYKAVPELSAGQWIVKEHWKGAILKLPEVNPDSLKQFMQEVTDWFL